MYRRSISANVLRVATIAALATLPVEATDPPKSQAALAISPADNRTKRHRHVLRGHR
jgi:hypothetical protein